MTSIPGDAVPIAIPTEVFDLPVHEMRRGYRSDVYFWRAKRTLERVGHRDIATVQVFQKQQAVLCGVEESLAILLLGVGHYRDSARAFDWFDELIELKKRIRSLYRGDPVKLREALEQRRWVEGALDQEWVSHAQDIKVYTLRDGDRVAPMETSLLIEGPIGEFIHLETLYLGVLARRTRIATNVSGVTRAANGKPVFFFPARFDHWAVQGGDGYAASIGGAESVSTDAQGEWWGMKGAGTIPHGLIAAFGGDTVAATQHFADAFPDTPLVALVDFENDCVKTSLEVARALKERLWAVRLDTSERLVDISVAATLGADAPTGVNSQLVENVRKALDDEGFGYVRIVVTGGFDAEKITRFEAEDVPTDAYGVGSAFLSGQFDFTADIVKLNGRPMAKVGRAFQPNERLVMRKLSS